MPGHETKRIIKRKQESIRLLVFILKMDSCNGFLFYHSFSSCPPRLVTARLYFMRKRLLASWDSTVSPLQIQLLSFILLRLNLKVKRRKEWMLEDLMLNAAIALDPAFIIFSITYKIISYLCCLNISFIIISSLVF